MTAAESAALERLIAAAENHPAALMLSSSHREEYIAEARRVSRDGLSRREAVKVADALDTAGERSNVQTLLTALVSKADAALLLKWLLNAVQSALATPPAQSPTVPDIAQDSPITPHAGPILYLPATCGWFNGGEDMGAILRWLATYRGRVGLGLEFTGSTGNLGVNTVDWRGAYQAHALKAVAVVSAAAAAGVPTKGDGINTNDFGKGWSAGWKDTPANRAAVLVITKQLAEGLLPLASWCTIQPYSESKDWMPADFRRAVFDAWVKAGWSKARLCGGGIAETHTGKLEALKPPALAATDNGPAIEAHFGKGVWTAHTPHIARCSAYANHYLARGVHVSLYHRADRLHLLEHRAAYDAIITAATGWRDSSPVAPPSSDGTPGAAMIFRYVGGGQRDVSWAPAVDRSGWPTKSVDGATCDGLLYGARVGEESRKIEWIKRGQQSAHTKNAWAFAKDRKYNQGWAGGERVRLEIRDVAGNAKGHGGEVVLA